MLSHLLAANVRMTWAWTQPFQVDKLRVHVSLQEFVKLYDCLCIFIGYEATCKIPEQNTQLDKVQPASLPECSQGSYPQKDQCIYYTEVYFIQVSDESLMKTSLSLNHSSGKVATIGYEQGLGGPSHNGESMCLEVVLRSLLPALATLFSSTHGTSQKAYCLYEGKHTSDPIKLSINSTK